MIRNKYAFFDLDYTTYDGYTINDFCFFLAKEIEDRKWIYAENTKIGALYVSKQIDYKEASIKVNEMIGRALKGLTVYQVDELLRRFLIENEHKFFDWAIDLIKMLKKNGFEIVLVSASIEPIVKKIAKKLEILEHCSSSLILENDLYSGTVKEILNFEHKKIFIESILENSHKNSFKLGFGDSTGDVAMLEMMDHAFVVDPHQQEMREIAEKNNWYVTKDGSGIITNVIKAIEKFELDS